MYRIDEEIGVISVTKGGWQLELNLVTWNDNGQKYDLRRWAPERGAMSKGVTLTKDEIVSLYHILKNEVGRLEGEEE